MEIIDKIIKEELEYRQDIQQLFEMSMMDISNFNVYEIGWGDRKRNLDLFEFLYELEYKYSMMKMQPFKGVERRRENMLVLLKARAESVIEVISKSFIEVFEDWLSKHALLSPTKWAKARVKEALEIGESTEGVFLSLVSEYSRYIYGLSRKAEKSFYEMVSNALENLNDYPAFSEYLEGTVLEGQKEWMINDLYDEGVEEFNERFGKDFETQDEAEDYISDMSLEDIDISETFFFESIEQFTSMLENFPRWKEIAIEFNANLVFPVWYGHWSGHGIEGTRENIEEVYKQLKEISSEPIEEQFVIINRATNITHQTGNMIDYYSEKYEVGADDLEELSNLDVSDWNRELHLVGVQNLEY